MSPEIEIQIIASLVAIACAIPGVFLVLRKMALISDAISHSILPGIVVGFFLTQNLNSPWLILLAALSGVLTVILVEFIQKTGLVKEDTAIGLVFPALFSIGVIMIAQNANDIHLDVDAVLLGELAFAPFDRWLFNGVDMGAKSIWVIGTIVFLNVGLVLLFFKELKLSTFDAGLSVSLGFSPVLIHYGLMTMASFTTVGSFEAVGAILVVALIIAPAATAYLITKDLKKMMFLAIIFGIFAAIAGYWIATFLDASIAGAITSVLGVGFLLAYLFAPKTGIITNYFLHKRQQVEVALLTLLLYLSKDKADYQRDPNFLRKEFKWQMNKFNKVKNLAIENELITIENNLFILSKKGEEFSEKTLAFIVDNESKEIEELKDQFFLFRA